LNFIEYHRMISREYKLGEEKRRNELLKIMKSEFADLCEQVEKNGFDLTIEVMEKLIYQNEVFRPKFIEMINKRHSTDPLEVFESLLDEAEFNAYYIGSF
jgi:precorrin-6B methylase 1